MKDEYDFTEAEQGKFYREDAVARLPIYLDPALQGRLEAVAEKEGTDLQNLVNTLLTQEIENH